MICRTRKRLSPHSWPSEDSKKRTNAEMSKCSCTTHRDRDDRDGMPGRIYSTMAKIGRERTDLIALCRHVEIVTTNETAE
jgi:hypothetical protein